MNYSRLVSVVVVLMASVSADMPLSETLTASAYNGDALQSAVMDRSIALFMPGSILVTTDELTSNEEGC